MRYGGSIKKELGLVDRANTRLKCYAEPIEQATRQRHQTSLLSEIQRQLHFSDDGQIEGQPVNYLIEQLQRRAAMAELRHFGLYYVFAQSLLLWDFHCIRALRGWRSRYGQHIKSWLDALAAYEVLCIAASVRHDEPDWCFPDLESGALTFRGIELGHPVISEQSRVCNDVQIGPDQRLLLLSEATSTNALALLKAIGIDDRQSTA